MVNTSNSNRLITSVTAIFFSIILLFSCYPNSAGKVYRENYIVDAVCIIVCLFLYLNQYTKGITDLFSISTLFSFLYIMMFFITPIYDICLGEYTWFGVNLFDSGVKSSLLALLGFCVYCFVTFNQFKIGNYQFNNYYSNDEKTEEIDIHKERESIICFILFGYSVCLAANIVYLVASGGKSVLYIISMGMFGSTENSKVANLGAISMLSFALPSFTLMYFEYGRSKWLKGLSFLLMLELQVARGFRFFVLQIVAMFCSYYYIKNDKKPRLSQIIILSLATLVPIMLMTLFRDTIRAGSGMDFSAVSKSTIVKALDSAFWNNFRIYKDYYAVVKAVPQYTSFLYGAQTIVYTIVMLIPRAIWHSKPSNPGTEAQRIILGDVAVKSGSAYPNLGEFYYDFGIVGIVFWMIVFGTFWKRIETRYRYNRNSSIDLMIYCTVLGTVLQFTIRGYMPGNIWMLVFCIIPYWLFKKCFFAEKNKAHSRFFRFML